MANVCGMDRGIRIVAGGALLALALVGPLADMLFPWGLIGAVPLLTGLMAWCPAYSIFGFKGCHQS